MYPVDDGGWLGEENGIIREVLRFDASILYLRPTDEENTQARIVSFKDARFPHPTDRKRAQEGCLYGIAFGTSEGSIFQTIRFVSRTQRRRSQSTCTETIAAIMGYRYAAHLREGYSDR